MYIPCNVYGPSAVRCGGGFPRRESALYTLFYRFMGLKVRELTLFRFNTRYDIGFQWITLTWGELVSLLFRGKDRRKEGDECRCDGMFAYDRSGDLFVVR